MLPQLSVSFKDAARLSSRTGCVVALLLFPSHCSTAKGGEGAGGAPSSSFSPGMYRGTCTMPGEIFSTDSSTCYFQTITPKSWQDTAAECQTWGGSLATISEPEVGLLVPLLTADVWIGINDIDKEETFVWANGEVSEWTNWLFAEPNNYMGMQNCGKMIRAGGNWDDDNCATLMQGLCEGRFALPGAGGTGAM